MSLVKTALHLCTGDATAAAAIQAWLRTHAVGGTDFTDVYEACAYLIQNRALAPDLAFVGTDWLAADEFLILRYLRETWPAVGVIVYSGGADARPVESGPLTRVCRSRASLRQLLADPPDVVLRALRAQASEAVPAWPTPRLRLDLVQPVRPQTLLTSEELSALLDEQSG